MPILIVVEDGSAKPDSNAYVDVATARAYALQRGIALDPSDDAVAAHLVASTDYLETFACRYQGERATATQALEWPRTGVVLSGQPWPPDMIPRQLQAAQCQLVIAQHQGFTLQPNYSAQDYIIREKVGPIETEYADPTSVGITATYTAVEALLAPLFGECANGGAGFRTVRV